MLEIDIFGRRPQAVTSRGLADEVTSTIAMNNLIAERVRQCKEKDVKRLAHECLKKMESKMDKVWNPSSQVRPAWGLCWMLLGRSS